LVNFEITLDDNEFFAVVTSRHTVSIESHLNIMSAVLAMTMNQIDGGTSITGVANSVCLAACGCLPGFM